MLQKLDDLLLKYELSDNYYEKARILRELQYFNMVLRKSLKSFVDGLSPLELEDIANKYHIEGDSESIRTTLYTRLNCNRDIFSDLSKVNRRISITRSIIKLAENHEITITNDQEFIWLLSDFINKCPN